MMEISISQAFDGNFHKINYEVIKMLNYGEALKAQRELAGLSQRQLSKQTGINQDNLSRWERNEVLPNIDFCVRLADFYHISVDELIGRYY